MEWGGIMSVKNNWADGDTFTAAAANDVANAVNLSGMITAYGSRRAPTGWLNCDGAAVSRTTYAALFAAIVPSLGTFTVTLATPGVFSLTAHGLSTGDAVYLTTTGALPTGLVANTLYYVVRVDANSFNLATTRANAYAGTKIATSGSQSGTHTAWDCPHGLGDGSTTFNVPDLRGRTPAGLDTTAGIAASRLTLAQSQGVYGNLGATGGEQGHQITVAELASHTHDFVAHPVTGGGTAGAANTSNSGSGPTVTVTSAGSDTAHNNVQPTVLVNYIIKT